MRDINYIVIHHAAVVQNNLSKLIASMNNTHKARGLHTSKNGLGYYIAYHYVIGVDGEIKQTRPDAEYGNHASNAMVNKTSIGILLSGNLDIKEPTEQQMSALISLVNKLKITYGDTVLVKYHKDFANKSCPGIKFPYDLFNKLIAMSSKFKEIFKAEVTDPIFNVHDDNENCTIADAKYLMEIGIHRALKKVYSYIDSENSKERGMINRVISFFKNI